MTNREELESRINQSPIILSGTLLAKGCRAYEELANDLYALAETYPDIYGHRTGNFPDEMNDSMEHCLLCYDPCKGSFTNYFRKDFTFRVRSALNKEAKHLEELGTDGYESEDGDKESREDAMDRCYLHSGNREATDASPAEEICRLITLEEIKGAMLRGFNEMQDRSKEKIAACLTANFYEGLGEDNIIDLGLYKLPVFHREIYARCILRQVA